MQATDEIPPHLLYVGKAQSKKERYAALAKVGRPSAEACCEMLLLLVFAPLLVTDIRAPVSTSISAVDASPWACASVAAEL